MNVLFVRPFVRLKFASTTPLKLTAECNMVKLSQIQCIILHHLFFSICTCRTFGFPTVSFHFHFLFAQYTKWYMYMYGNINLLFFLSVQYTKWYLYGVLNYLYFLSAPYQMIHVCRFKPFVFYLFTVPNNTCMEI